MTKARVSKVVRPDHIATLVSRIRERVAKLEDLVEVMAVVQDVHLSKVVAKHVVEPVRRTRSNELSEFGCSPRAALTSGSQPSISVSETRPIVNTVRPHLQ
jgi:hypothetical protein